MVEVQHVNKAFGATVACEDVCCEFRNGEIHTVLGQNGAGKSTLMKILAGLMSPDRGQIRIRGDTCTFRSPADARRAGVGMMQQHFSLVGAFTVAENLALTASTGRIGFRPRAWQYHLKSEAERLGLDIRLDVMAADLSVGERQRVEIFRLLLQEAAILILDEPTSVISSAEAKPLFARLRSLADTGHAVILITHKLSDALTVSDRLTVMRRGRVVLRGCPQEFGAEAVEEAMIGEPPHINNSTQRMPINENIPVLLRVKRLSVKPRTSRVGVSGVSFEVRAGEVFGIAGLSGNGQDELAAAVAGLTRYSGSVEHFWSVETRRADAAFVPDDGSGCALPLSVEENLAARCYRTTLAQRSLWINRSAVREFCDELIGRFGISVNDTHQSLASLSGGNRQRVLVARELDRHVPLLVMVNPTAGLDFAGQRYVHHQLCAHTGAGGAALVVAEDLEELATICNRVMVLYRGNQVAVFSSPAEQMRDMALAIIGRYHEVQKA